MSDPVDNERLLGVETHAEHLLREFVRARMRGDDSEMSRSWSLLLTAEWPRLRNLVALHGRGRLRSNAEREDAVSEAGQRMARRLIKTFDGSTLDEYRERMSGLVRISCLDVQRKAARHNEHEGPSLDALSPNGDQATWIGDTYARIEEERTAVRREDEEFEEEIVMGQGFLDRAVPQLTPKRRAVFERLRAGMSPTEIQEELGITRNDVDQTKRRAIQDLIKLKEQYPS